MQRKEAEQLLGVVLNHKIFGAVYVKEIVSAEDDKIKVIIEKTQEEKTLILSLDYFEKIEGISLKKKFNNNNIRRREYKPRDVNKFRNHPLIKQIDKQENYAEKYRNNNGYHVDDEEDSED